MKAFLLLFLTLPAWSMDKKCEDPKTLELNAPQVIEFAAYHKGFIKLPDETLETGMPGRVVRLPSLLNKLVGIKDLKVVVLAGNTHYDGTRHNLAFHFGDYLIAKHFSEQPTVREKIPITFDDGSYRSEVVEFKSTVGLQRTRSGEVFFFEGSPGQRILLVKPLGDYNEIGDFAISVLRFLNLPPQSLLVVYDDLKMPEGSTSLLAADEPVKPQGNHALGSINRGLLLGMDQFVVDFFEKDPHLKTFLSKHERPLAHFQVRFREAFGVRTGREMIQNERAFEMVLKNLLKDMMGQLVPEWEEKQARIRKIEKNLASARDRKRAQETSGRTDEAVKTTGLIANLERELGEINGYFVHATGVEGLNAFVNGVIEQAMAEVRRRLTYERLSLGTGYEDLSDPKPDLVDFVLGPLPPSLLEKSYFENVEATLINSRP